MKERNFAINSLNWLINHDGIGFDPTEKFQTVSSWKLEQIGENEKGWKVYKFVDEPTDKITNSMRLAWVPGPVKMDKISRKIGCFVEIHQPY